MSAPSPTAVVCHPAVVVPEHVLTKETVVAAVERVLGADHRHVGRLRKIIENSGIEKRYLVQSLEDTIATVGFGARNDLFIAASKSLGERAARLAMERANVQPQDIDCIITTSCTGIMIPSLCAHLVPVLGLPRTITRLPLTERGCAAGAFGLAQARQHIVANGGGNVLIVAHEFCSLTYQREDLTMQALVGAMLFGDGVSACVVRGDGKHEGPGFALGPSRSWLFEDSWGYMGFDVRDAGLHLVLDKGIPNAVERQIRPVMLGFLESQGFTGHDVDFHVLHPGGRKVLDEVARTFELSADALAPSRECLAEVGNLSSASILVVLRNIFERHAPQPGQRGLMTAFGPGFSCEMSLGTWVG